MIRITICITNSFSEFTHLCNLDFVFLRYENFYKRYICLRKDRFLQAFHSGQNPDNVLFESQGSLRMLVHIWFVSELKNN